MIAGQLLSWQGLAVDGVDRIIGLGWSDSRHRNVIRLLGKEADWRKSLDLLALSSQDSEALVSLRVLDDVGSREQVDPATAAEKCAGSALDPPLVTVPEDR